MSQDWSPLSLQETIDLPYVGGVREQDEADPPDALKVVYDDSTDVQVEQSHVGKPYCTLRFIPAGPCEFSVLGFGPDELEKLANFLKDAAAELRDHAARYEAAGPNGGET